MTFAVNIAQGGANNTTMRNRIINGAMVIDQRNAGASVSVTAGPFTLDRWAAQTPTGGSVQQITSTITGFVNSFKYTASASNAYLQMGQQIEYLNCYDLQNTTVSISFWAKANNSNAGSTALTVRTRTAAAINGAARFTGTNVDTAVTITTSAVQYTVTRTLPATFGALSLEFVLGANVSGDGFEITGVQLEAGTTASPFEYRQYGTELALCQRYAYVWTTTVTQAAIASGFQYNASTAYYTVNFPVQMRSAPTLNSVTASNWKNVYQGGQGTTTSVVINASSINSAALSVSQTSSTGYSNILWSGTTSANMQFVAEL